MALVESGNPNGAAGSIRRLLLDACASGPPILEDGPAASFNWVVFPRSTETVLLLVNRSPESEVRAGSITLTEIEDAAGGPTGPEPASPSSRALGLYLSGSDALDRFGAHAGSNDPLRTAQNLVKYLGCCGATALVLPEDLADRRVRRSLDGQADEDSTGPDRLELIRRIMARQGYALWLELGFDGPDSLPGLPSADSPEALRRGLVRVDSQGQADGPAYNPLNPEVREAMKLRVTSALAGLKAGEPGGGILIRLGPGPTLLGTPDTGLDDTTYKGHSTTRSGRRPLAVFPGSRATSPTGLRYVRGTWRG